jgi:hypothetical protein
VGHLPHVYVAPPWGPAPDGADATLTLDDQVRHHLEKVLRRTSVAVTYTDGLGTVGSGRFESGRLHRGAERMEPAPTPHLTVAVAPPRRTERVRFVVEKLAELGVARLRWIRTAHTVGRPPHPAKAAAWAVGALEQSRGAHLLEVEGTFDPLDSVSPGTAGPGAEDAGGVVYADVDSPLLKISLLQSSMWRRSFQRETLFSQNRPFREGYEEGSEFSEFLEGLFRVEHIHF